MRLLSSKKGGTKTRAGDRMNILRVLYETIYNTHNIKPSKNGTAKENSNGDHRTRQAVANIGGKYTEPPQFKLCLNT